MRKTPIEERFWPKVQAADCWEWTGGKTQDGYGITTVEGKTRVAHRVAWQMLVGVIPEGLQLDHLCKNRSCVNPDHLEPVTPRENIKRGHVGHHPNSRRWKQAAS